MHVVNKRTYNGVFYDKCKMTNRTSYELLFHVIRTLLSRETFTFLVCDSFVSNISNFIKKCKFSFYHININEISIHENVEYDVSFCRFVIVRTVIPVGC